jgi:hypothetical protein
MNMAKKPKKDEFGGHIIVAWSTGKHGVEDKLTDFWETFESMPEAKKRYDEVLEMEDTEIASILGVIESTDYEPYKGSQEAKPKDNAAWRGACAAGI